MEKKRKNTESEYKATKPHHSSYGTVIVPQRSSEKPLGKPSELDEILQITKSNSSGLAASSSSTDDDTFVGHMEAKFDLYNEKYGLIQRFGKHLDELKEKQGKSSRIFFGRFHTSVSLMFMFVYFLFFNSRSPRKRISSRRGTRGCGEGYNN